MADKAQARGGRRTVILVAVFVALVCVAVGMIVWATTRKSNEKDDSAEELSWKVGNADLRRNTQTYYLFNGLSVKFNGQLGVNQSLGIPRDCTQDVKMDLCLDWDKDRKLEIVHSQTGEVSCYDIEWTAKMCPGQILKDCYDIGASHWYGGYEDYHQYWPLERTTRETSAYVPTDTYMDKIGDVVDRYFISTDGIGIFIEKDVPLFISINETHDKRICLTSTYNGIYPYVNTQGKLPFLKYHVCQALNVRTIHDYMSNRFRSKPLDIPDEQIFKYPIWSTWAQYHTDINQTTTLQFADDILNNNLSHSQLEIDDNWTPKYGDMTFDMSKFPDARGMMEDLTNKGFRVTIWIHPFFNIDSENFKIGALKKYFLRQVGSDLPALVSWWRGNAAAVLDVSNPEAVVWFLGFLNQLQTEYNISSFKFDGGNGNAIPKVFVFQNNDSNPYVYAELWSRLAYQSDTIVRHQEVRVGASTQDLPMFVRVLDLTSSWGRNNGLEKLIPVAMTFGLLGYPYVLPDMIGGNGYIGLPDRELYIRWLQANTFLPAMQFSIGPWLFDEAVVNISREYIDLHSKYAEVFISLAREATRTGAPIIRPLWWVAPGDENAQTIDSEFLLGNDILVAPILKKGARHRDIYLVEGAWQDMLRGSVLQQGWIRDYAADIHELPYFIRLNGSVATS
ncbi:myogenesis-regulating glycosidase-like [Ylistrum balloti]|uniref:myogenesis-regulating glycosidase-like n=1 Tax=Ylistrum balloti TaxID=509963 RepID=UPI0029058685|nr:myogenesis-regulating glycosidase-like [Ylistrum balloti]